MKRVLSRMTTVAATATTILGVGFGSARAGGLFHHHQQQQAAPVQAQSFVSAVPVMTATAVPVYVAARPGLGLFRSRSVLLNSAPAPFSNVQFSNSVVQTSIPVVSSGMTVMTVPAGTTIVQSGGTTSNFVQSNNIVQSDNLGDEVDVLVSSNFQVQSLANRLGNKNHVRDLKNHLHLAIRKKLQELGGNLRGIDWKSLLFKLANAFLKNRFGIDLSNPFESATPGVNGLIDAVLQEESAAIGNKPINGNGNGNVIFKPGQVYRFEGTLRPDDGQIVPNNPIPNNPIPNNNNPTQAPGGDDDAPPAMPGGG